MKRMFKTFLTIVKINPLLYVVLFVFSVLSEFVPLLTGILIRDLFSALDMHQTQEFFIIAIFFSLVLLGQRLMQYQYGMVDARITFETDRFYIFNILEKIMIFGKSVSVGTVMNIFNIDLKQINYQGMSIIDLLSRAIFLVSAIVIMFFNNQLITIVIIIPFMIGNILLLMGEKRYLSYYASQRDVSLDYFSFLHVLIENTTHYRYLDSRGIHKQLEKLNLPAQKKALKKEIYLQVLRSGITLLNHLVIVFIVILGWNEGLSLGTMIMFITYVSSAFNFSLLFNAVLNNQSQFKFFEEKFNAIETEIANISNKEADKPINRHSIEKVNAKMTQLNLGEILQIKNFDRNQLFSLLKEFDEDIGFVSSELHLFDETVDKNLTLFTSKRISESELIESLNISNFPLDKRILPSIGSNGLKLSAGERQRLGIARALLVGNIIIMDMSFENIDFDTKIEIIKGLKTLKKKYVIISNDSQIEKYSDDVLNDYNYS